MNNEDKVQDLLDRAKEYINKDTKQEPKSRIPLEEIEEHQKAFEKAVDILSRTIKTGFNSLDKIINLNKPQLITLVDKLEGRRAGELSGDIANNISLEQEIPVLELVSCFKEYLIKRLVINQCKVDYRSWYPKHYTDEEFIKIGKTMTDLIETTKKLPYIEELGRQSIKQVKNRIINYVIENRIDENKTGLVVIDSNSFTFMEKDKIDKKIMNTWIKELQKIVKKYHVSMILTYSPDINNYKKELEISDVDTSIIKYSDSIVLMNENKSNENIDLKIYMNNKMEKCTIKYSRKYRKFEDVRNEN